MKRRSLVMLLFLVLFALTACGKSESSEVVYEDVVEDEYSAEPVDIFNVDKQIYSDDRLDLTCKNISNKGVLFECKNKTPRDVEFYFDIALDGVLQQTWNEVNMVPSGETVEILCQQSGNYDNKKTEHKTITVVGRGVIEGQEYLTFNVTDF